MSPSKRRLCAVHEFLAVETLGFSTRDLLVENEAECDENFNIFWRIGLWGAIGINKSES